PDGATIGTTSFGIGGLPEQLIVGLGKYYKKHKHPKEITYSKTDGIGVGERRGLDNLIEPELIKRVVTSHIATSPLANQATQENKFEMYQLPQGIIGKLYRNAAGKGPGVFSQIGIDTFIDPKNEGGKLNQKAEEAFNLSHKIFSYFSFLVQYSFFIDPINEDGKLYQKAEEVFNISHKIFSFFSFLVQISFFIDPKNEEGKLNQKAEEAEDLVREIELNGERWLHYKPLPVNVAFIKATYADKNGNLS